MAGKQITEVLTHSLRHSA